MSNYNIGDDNISCSLDTDCSKNGYCCSESSHYCVPTSDDSVTCVGSKTPAWLIIVIVALTLIVVGLICLICVLIKRLRRKNNKEEEGSYSRKESAVGYIKILTPKGSIMEQMNTH